MSRSITIENYRSGLNMYREMLNAPSPYCGIFAYPASLTCLYYLYKSISGKIYVLYSLSGFIIYYQLIEDDSWFTDHLTFELTLNLTDK
jgi:hypothetical protein